MVYFGAPCPAQGPVRVISHSDGRSLEGFVSVDTPPPAVAGICEAFYVRLEDGRIAEELLLYKGGELEDAVAKIRLEAGGGADEASAALQVGSLRSQSRVVEQIVSTESAAFWWSHEEEWNRATAASCIREFRNPPFVSAGAVDDFQNTVYMKAVDSVCALMHSHELPPVEAARTVYRLEGAQKRSVSQQWVTGRGARARYTSCEVRFYGKDSCDWTDPDEAAALVNESVDVHTEDGVLVLAVAMLYDSDVDTGLFRRRKSGVGALLKPNIHAFTISDLVPCRIRHSLVPRHSVLDDADRACVVAAFGSNLPYARSDDIVVRHLCAHVGDVVKIERKCRIVLAQCRTGRIACTLSSPMQAMPEDASRAIAEVGFAVAFEYFSKYVPEGQVNGLGSCIWCQTEQMDGLVIGYNEADDTHVVVFKNGKQNSGYKCGSHTVVRPRRPAVCSSSDVLAELRAGECYCRIIMQ